MTRQNESNQDEPNEWEKTERVYNYLPKHSLEIAKPKPFNSQDLIVNSPLYLLHISW